MLTPKRILLVAALIVAGVVGFKTQQQTISVEVAQRTASVDIEVFGLGTVEARVQSKISFRQSNMITDLFVDQGQRVQKGDLLARLDTNQQQAKLAKSQASLMSGEANLSSANAAILKAKAVLAKKTRTNKRQQALYAKRTISAEKVEIAKLEQDIAQAELDMTYSNRLAAKAAVNTAQAQVQLDQLSLDDHTLLAPYDAMIVTRHMELGSVAKIGEPVFTLVDPDTIWVLAHISESRSGLIKIGNPATIRLRSQPHKLINGTVQRIDIESDRITEERRVYISCDSCTSNFSLGEQAEVHINTATLSNVLLIPENAVDQFNERQMKGTIWILEKGQLKKQSVSFGHRTLDARLTVQTALAPSIQVLTRLPQVLSEGRKAEISP